MDTSVWVDHLRSGIPELAARLEGGEVLIHPWVIGELACGNLRDRQGVLTLLQGLPMAEAASDPEVFALLERHQLMGRGIGWIDAHLLASALLARGPLWSNDRRLARIAGELGVGWSGGGRRRLR
ncbi:MAG: type II toxin-antitoxin system VapC family toxin [Cyanobium sp.]